jgi:hypothetical protein
VAVALVSGLTDVVGVGETVGASDGEKPVALTGL